MRFLMYEPDKNVQKNAYLQIAWKVLFFFIILQLVFSLTSLILIPYNRNAATVGLSPNKIKRGLLNRNTIMLYDIPKFCQLLENEQEPMLLRTKARLLYGASKIMKQKTLFLYDDSLQLYSKLQSAMIVPTKTDHINLERPITSSLSITLKDKDDLLEYQTSHAAPLSDLFDFTHAKRRTATQADNDMDEDLCSILKMTNSLSIDLPQTEFEYPEMFLPSFTDNQYFSNHLSNNNGAPVAVDRVAGGTVTNGIDNHDVQDLFGDDGGYFDDGANILAHDNIVPPHSLDETNQHSSALMDDSVFEYPNNLNVADIMDRSTSSRSSSSSTSTDAAAAAGPTNYYGFMSGGYHRHPSGGIEQLPSLIREEDENTISSIATDMYPGIISENEEDQEDIVVSLVPPERYRPRIVKRMMLQNEGDTMLPWSAYNAETITRHDNEDQIFAGGGGSRKKNRIQLIQNQIRFPSIVIINPYQKSNIETSLMEEGVGRVEKFAQSVINDSRYKFFFPHVENPNEMNDNNTGHARIRNYTEIARRADHRLRNTFGNSTSSGSSQERGDGLGGTGRPHVSLRSASDLTTPDMHHLDLDDLDNMQDARSEGNAPSTFTEGGMDDFHDDPINYDYLDFDNNFQDVLSDASNPMMDTQANIIDENGLHDFEEELHLFALPENQNHVDVNSLFQVKNRSEVAKSFYYLLDLASKSKIKVSQMESFETIDVQFV